MLNKLTFMLELAQWLSKQEHLKDVDEQIEAMEQIKSHLREEQQIEIKSINTN